LTAGVYGVKVRHQGACCRVQILDHRANRLQSECQGMAGAYVA
jgi:hypothetical protein